MSWFKKKLPDHFKERALFFIHGGQWSVLQNTGLISTFGGIASFSDAGYAFFVFVQFTDADPDPPNKKQDPTVLFNARNIQ